METFTRKIERSKLFPINTSKHKLEVLYLVSKFSNWERVYNSCVDTHLNDEQLVMITNTINSVNYSPNTWIRSLCIVMTNAMDNLAIDLLTSKINILKKHDKRKIKFDSLIVNKDIITNISALFMRFYMEITNASESQDYEVDFSLLTIDNVDVIDEIRTKKKENREIKLTFMHLVDELRTTELTLWFVIYLLVHLEDDYYNDVFDYLQNLTHGKAFLTRQMFSIVKKWKTKQSNSIMKNALDNDTMFFLFMYHRAS